jgi:ATP-dependent RNA helicase DDX27
MQDAADGGESDLEQELQERSLAVVRAQRQQSHAQATSRAAAAVQEAPGKRPAFYAQTPDGTKFSAGSFSDLHLSRPLLKACAALGYTHPTPIQVHPRGHKLLVF